MKIEISYWIIWGPNYFFVDILSPMELSDHYIFLKNEYKNQFVPSGYTFTDENGFYYLGKDLNLIKKKKSQIS